MYIFLCKFIQTLKIVFQYLGQPYKHAPQTVVVNPGDNLTLSLSLISFSAQFSLVLVRNKNNEIIHRCSVSFAPTKVTLSAFGRTVKLYGYNCRLNMLNIARE